MSKKRDDFGTIKFTQEELMNKIQPKKAPLRPPTPPPVDPNRTPTGQTSKELPALTPPVPPGKSSPDLQALKPPSGTANPALKSGTAKPGKSVIEKKATEVCAQANLSDEAKPLLQPDMTVQAFAQVLQDNKLSLDMVKVIAFTLPKREAIGWGLHCVKQVYGPNPPKPVGAVIHATQLWLAEQNETHRRLAYDTAEAVEVATPAGCIGLAVFFSGGSLAPVNSPPVAPAPNLTHQAVANALQLASIQTAPENAAEKLAQYAGDGLKLAALVPDTNGSPKAGAA